LWGSSSRPIDINRL